jgi:hypothetical protein
MGDGYKEQLSTTLMTAVTRHCQYCEDTIFDPPDLQGIALKMADYTKAFWMQLVAYLDNEYHMLFCLSNSWRNISSCYFPTR